MADKDTREDDGAHGEVLLPLADGSRSEGGPASRRESGGDGADPNLPAVSEAPEVSFPAPDAPPPADPAVLEDILPEAAAPEDAVEASPPAGFEADPMPSEARAPPAAEERFVADVRDVDPRETEPWHSAIADALAEPDASPSDAPDAQEPTPESSPTPAEFEPDPQPLAASTDVRPIAPSRHPLPMADAPPVDDVAPRPVTRSAPDANPASFTTAAQDLFRPPALEANEEPHLVTLGRRLDPSLRIPRPVLPDIAPRPEPGPAAEQLPWWKTPLWRDRLRTGARYAAYAVGGYLALVLVLILLFRFVNPPGSMLMLTRLLTGTGIDRTWVPLSSISPHLVRAVVVSEDGRFCEHSGIDTEAIKEAIERASGGVPRGASTISMQVIKNLFLWNAKSYVRKVIEIPLTLFMEIVWPKWRILEVYLNSAEWGPGVFGAEAAARYHFNKPAARLSEREAALLAAVLPNPVVRDAGSPNAQTSAKARVVQSRVRAYGAVASCVVSASGAARAAVGPVGTRPRTTIRKTAPPRPAPGKKQPADDWAPTLNFGPK